MLYELKDNQFTKLAHTPVEIQGCVVCGSVVGYVTGAFPGRWFKVEGPDQDDVLRQALEQLRNRGVTGLISVEWR